MSNIYSVDLCLTFSMTPTDDILLSCMVNASHDCHKSMSLSILTFDKSLHVVHCYNIINSTMSYREAFPTSTSSFDIWIIEDKFTTKL